MNDDIFRTSDLGLAVFLAWKGCPEAMPPWQIVSTPKGRKCIEFGFTGVTRELVAEFRRDDEGIQRYNGLRRHFLRIVHTEIGGDENGR